MIWANGMVNRIKAEPGLIGYCPICKEELIPKCGWGVILTKKEFLKQHGGK